MSQTEAAGIAAFSVPQGLAALGAVLAAVARRPCTASTLPVQTAAAHMSWAKLLQATRRTAGKTPAFLAEFAERQVDSESMQPSVAIGRGGQYPGRASSDLQQLEQVVRDAAASIAGRPIGADEPLVAAGAARSNQYQHLPCTEQMLQVSKGDTAYVRSQLYPA